jgi:hypothetical protein
MTFVSFRRAALALALGGVLLSCSRPDEPSSHPAASSPPSGPPPTPAAVAAQAPPETTLHWSDPSRWVRRPPTNGMRVAEYRVPGAGGAGDAECTVITFGSHQGGGLDANVTRWVQQFGPLSGPPTRTTRFVRSAPVTRVELAGTYHPMTMPGGPDAGAQPDSRLIGAIVQVPSGEWFFKMTGPDATVKAAAPEFDAMIDSVRTP